MLYVPFYCHGYWPTKKNKSPPPLLPGPPLAETPPIRGPARLSGRGPSRQRRGPRLRLLPQLLPRPLSPFSQRNSSHLFPLSAARPSVPTQKVRASLSDHQVAQAEPLRL